MALDTPNKLGIKSSNSAQRVSILFYRIKNQV